MTRKITVVDYDVGNLMSVRRAFEKIDCEVDLTSDPDKIASAERLVLPGVGAFGDCVTKLEESSLFEPIRNHAKSGNPLLGICVGMQMLMNKGEEFGEHEGIGFIQGNVRHIPSTDTDNNPLRVPNIGWSSIKISQDNASDYGKSFLSNEFESADVYFVHSFSVHPENPSNILATINYGGYDIVASVAKDNIIGTQFHPEKSGVVGLRMLEKFAAL